MKAITLSAYGNPEDLKLEDLPIPQPKENEVLIKVHATAVNDFDWSYVRGIPRVYRLFFGLFKPKSPIPGMELSGTIEALGNNVSAFKIGDRVFGDISDYKWGSFAEFIAIDARAVTIMPESMSFPEAAAFPHASMLAYQGLVELGKIKNHQKVLINGAGGGVGTFGVQIAKLYNCHVTGVDTGNKLEMMKSLGFDETIDYKKEDFTKNGIKYDLILDARSTRNPSDYERALKKDGTFVTVGGDVPKLIRILFRSMLGKKNMKMLSLKANKDLAIINHLYEEGKIKAIFEKPFPLEEAANAVRYFGEAKHSGKVIISVVPDQINAISE